MRLRPKSNQQAKINAEDICKQNLIKFEVSKPNLEWLARNWRMQRFCNIDKSPILVKSPSFLPSVREIMEGLIRA